MFALVLIALLVLLALASLTVLADSGLRWWSAFGALKRELAKYDGPSPHAPAKRRRTADRVVRGSRQLTLRGVLRAAA